MFHLTLRKDFLNLILGGCRRPICYQEKLGATGKWLLGGKSCLSSQFLRVFLLASKIRQFCKSCPSTGGGYIWRWQRRICVYTSCYQRTEILTLIFFSLRNKTAVSSPARCFIGSQMVDKENASSRWQLAPMCPYATCTPQDWKIHPSGNPSTAPANWLLCFRSKKWKFVLVGRNNCDSCFVWSQIIWSGLISC